MPKKENFDFKHKNPTEIKITDNKKPTNTNESIKDTIKQDTQEKQKKIKYIKEPIIRPKSETRNKRVQLLLTESNYLKIKEYAANSRTSVNDAINQIIENL